MFSGLKQASSTTESSVKLLVKMSFRTEKTVVVSVVDISTRNGD